MQTTYKVQELEIKQRNIEVEDYILNQRNDRVEEHRTLDQTRGLWGTYNNNKKKMDYPNTTVIITSHYKQKNSLIENLLTYLLTIRSPNLLRKLFSL